MSNFDLIEQVKKLKIKNHRGVFMRNQLPINPQIPETGIINLDDEDGPGTHWTCYAINVRGIVYFDSYGLPPPNEFYKYVRGISIPVWYSTLPTQTLNDPPICGREVLNVLSEISRSLKPPHIVVNEYTSGKFLHLKQQ